MPTLLLCAVGMMTLAWPQSCRWVPLATMTGQGWVQSGNECQLHTWAETIRKLASVSLELLVAILSPQDEDSTEEGNVERKRSPDSSQIDIAQESQHD